MLEKLVILLDKLKLQQKELIYAAARTECFPPTGLVRQISELENAIAAVEAIISEKEQLDKLAKKTRS